MTKLLNFSLVISFLAGATLTTAQKESNAAAIKGKGGCTPGSDAMNSSMRMAPIDKPAILADRITCSGGTAGDYPCSNVDLESFVPNTDLNLGSSTSANDIWGWTKNGREFAIIGLVTGTSFVEITDAENPVVLGKLPTKTSSSSWRDIKTFNDHAFIVSEAAGHGMQIFDLNTLLTASPNTVFTEDAHYGQFSNCHNVFLNEDTGFAYAVGTNTCSGGLHMVDVNNPLNPTNAGCFSNSGYTHDVQCVLYDGPDTDHTGKEICFASNEDTVDIIDVSNKSSPTIIKIVTYDNDEYTHQGWLTEDKKYFLFDDELDEMRNTVPNTRTFIVNVEDLDAPFLVGHYDAASAAIDHNQYVKGHHVYQANYRAGLRILDLSNVANGELTEVGYFDTYPQNDASSFNSAWSNYPYFDSGLVVISDIEKGLFVVRPNIGTLSPTVSPHPTPSPTVSPTTSPTISSQPTGCSGCATGEFSFKLEVMTDRYPQETSWSIENASGTSYGTNPVGMSQNTLYEEEYCLPENIIYTFTINDTFGDGVCCGYGNGYYRGYRNNESTETISGGDFDSSESKTFTGSDPCGGGSTPAPTSSPTPAPTPLPTMSPTALPTQSPTPPPTPPPGSQPTLPPTTTPPSVDPWAIGNAVATSSGNSITVSYPISTGPQDASVHLFEFDCTTPVTAPDVVSLSTSPITYNNDNVTFGLSLDESLLSTSNLVDFVDDNIEGAGSIQFCTKTVTETSDGMGVAYKKAKFDVSFNMTSVTFSISDVSISSQDVEEVNLQITFSVSACECDENFSCGTFTYLQSNSAPLFRVCLTPSSDDTNISNMFLLMTGTDGYIYDPVELGIDGPETDELSTIKYQGNKMMVETRIVDPLFVGGSFDVSGAALLSTTAGAGKADEFVEYKMSVLVEAKPNEESQPLGCMQLLMGAVRSMF